MKTRRYYTNAEKIEYFKRRIEKLERPETQENSYQNWNEKVSEEILEKRIADIVAKVLERKKESGA